MRTALRYLRNTVLTLAGLVLVLGLVLADGVVWLRSAEGENWLRNEAVGQLNELLTDTGLQLSVEALEGPLPEQLRLRGLVLRDARGPWLTVDEAELRLDLEALLDPAVLVPSLAVRDARLERLPELPPSPPSEMKFPADLLTWYPSWLRFVRVDELLVERFTLPAELLGLTGEPLLVSARGSLAVPNAEEIRSSIRLDAGRAETPATETVNLNATLRTTLNNLKMELRFQEGPGGLVGALLNPALEGSTVPLPTGFSFTLTGSAPPLYWSGMMEAKAHGLASMEGKVELTLREEKSVHLELAVTPAPEMPEQWRALKFFWVAGGIRFREGWMETGFQLHVGPNEDIVRMIVDDLSVDMDNGGALEGRVRANLWRPKTFPDIAPFSAATVDLELGGTLTAPDVRLLTFLRGLQTPGLSAEQITVDATLAGTLAQPETRVRVLSPVVSASGKKFQNFDAELHALGEAVDWERPLASALKAELNVGLLTPHGPARLQAEAGLHEERLSLSKIQLSGLGVNVDGGLAFPLTMRDGARNPEHSATGTLTANVTDWAALSALLPVELRADKAEARLSLSPDKGQSLKLGWELRGLQAAGASLSALSGSLTGHDLFAAPKLDLQVDVGDGAADELLWKGAKVEVSADAGKQSARFAAALDSVTYGRVGETFPIMAQLSGALNDRKTLACTLNVSGLGLDPLEGRVNLPVRFVDGVPDIPPDGRLSGSLRWKGALASVWRLVPLANTRVRGDATLDVTLGGTVAKPRPSGVIRLEKMLFQDLAQAFEVSNIMAEIALQANGSGKVMVAGTDGKKGTFQLSGTVGPLEAGFPLDIQGSLDRLMPLQRRDVRLSLSGTGRVTGTPVAPDVTADITVNRGEVLLENLPSGGIETLDVVEAGTPQTSKTPQLGKTPQSGPTSTGEQPAETPAVGQLHVTVNVPRRFYVRGHGIESEWKGQLRVNGPFTAPAVAGDISSIRGTLSFLNKTFVLKRGSVTFDGGTPPRPMLDIQVVYTQQDFTALITLSGPATRPRLKLSSQPSLPTDEIVAQILFGKSTSNLARGEALQLAATVASLTLFGQNGGGLLDFTRSAFGLDVVRFGSGRSGQNSMAFSDSAFGAGSQTANQSDGSDDDLTLEVGKYVLDNVYVGLEQGMESDSTGVVVDIEVTPSLSLEARTTGRGSEVGAKWSWDY